MLQSNSCLSEFRRDSLRQIKIKKIKNLFFSALIVFGFIVASVLASMLIPAEGATTEAAAEINHPSIEDIQIFEVVGETIREVTAYNAGDPSQTDSSPCISANGDDICKDIASGERICAANFVPFGTILHIENFGDCIVKDRLNSRYKNRVDIAMAKDEYQRAKEFGVQNLNVRILERQ